MDTRAQHSERDRAISAPSHDEAAGQRSRSARVRGRLTRSVRSLSRRVRSACGVAVDPFRLPGGRATVALLLCGLCVLMADRLVMQPFEIPSGSMAPGLRAGDRVLVNKVAYRFGAEPQRGDVVVFDGTEYFGDADYIKRVVGVGGDHVVCCDGQGRIEVNDDPAVEDGYLYPGDVPSQVHFDVRVPDGTLFLLGDHRSASRDSRDRLGAPGGGMVPVAAVIGKASWVAWPVSHWDTAALAGGGEGARAGCLRGPAGPSRPDGPTKAAGLGGPPSGPATALDGGHG